MACVVAASLASSSFVPLAIAADAAKPDAAKPADPTKPAAGKPTADGKPAPAKPPSKKEKDAARKAYSDGEKAFQAGDFAAAYEGFKKANEIIPSSKALYWMAKAVDSQNKLEESIAAYETFLADPAATDAGQDKIDEAKKRVEELKAKLVFDVALDSTPPGASVSIDGTAQPGVTPMTVKLAPGMHKLSVTAQGYQPKESDLEVKSGQTNQQTIALTEVPKEAPPPPPPAPPPAPPPPPPPPPEKRSMVPAYVTLGIAAVGAGVGTYFGVKALSAKSDFNDNPTADSADDAERNALFADMLFGVAITLGVTGVVLLTSSDEAPAPAQASKVLPLKRPSVAFAPYVTPKGGGAAARLKF
ncbi:MAG TPA: PEGA domain-containing protein [Polyangiaceae bacterium]|jgi:hypothetical protein|nr:PEGA domain-containing protein [Polyangiaceae bacterium]